MGNPERGNPGWTMHTRNKPGWIMQERGRQADSDLSSRTDESPREDNR